MKAKDAAAAPAEPEAPAGGWPRSLAEQAHDALEELIVTMQLPPGSVWNEQSLAERIGVGRTPAREAIKLLESEHLIEIVPRHGVRISEIDLYRQMQVVELRGPLEILISRWAAVRATPDERTRLLAMADAFEVPARKRDPVAYLRNVFAANAFIAQCARNPFAAQAIASLHTLSRRFFYRYHDPKELEAFSDQHGARARGGRGRPRGGGGGGRHADEERGRLHADHHRAQPQPGLSASLLFFLNFHQP